VQRAESARNPLWARDNRLLNLDDANMANFKVAVY